VVLSSYDVSRRRILNSLVCVVGRYTANSHLPIVLQTFAFPSAHNSLANELAALAGDHSTLSFAVLAILVEYNPVSRFPHFVRAGCVRKHRYVVPLASLNAGLAARPPDWD
jgi:hypothetical protein